jgi:hypothetical protein
MKFQVTEVILVEKVKYERRHGLMIDPGNGIPHLNGPFYIAVM